ncbi:MAG TPA: tRNA pseudouridine(38-40) synthase TruA [Parafilimonas sp.]|nr:tRNA pseudouridine(38-40) synthase TruA [Parafilimonas sp.]
MSRYFLEVAYLGTHYSGFQVQKNANTIQREVERALKIYYQKDFSLTGSSRTDAGVHAEQNFFHFDADIIIQNENLYNLNALLNFDIAVKKIFEVQSTSHCRFDATSRMYHYHIHRKKNPFLFETSYYYPFSLNVDLLHQYATAIKSFKDFTSFSKKKTQVNHFFCNIQHSQWIIEDDIWRYEIKADRFLRGMVKAITGTMLKLAKNEAAVSELEKIVFSKNCNLADFSPPSKGLFLKEIRFNPSIFILS